MISKLVSSFLFAGLLAVAGCRSNDAEMAVDPADVPCTCGTPEAALEGCAHPLCTSGQGNPDNPDCVCGPLSLGNQN